MDILKWIIRNVFMYAGSVLISAYIISYFGPITSATPIMILSISVSILASIFTDE